MNSTIFIFSENRIIEQQNELVNDQNLETFKEKVTLEKVKNIFLDNDHDGQFFYQMTIQLEDNIQGVIKKKSSLFCIAFLYPFQKSIITNRTDIDLNQDPTMEIRLLSRRISEAFLSRMTFN